MAPRVQLSVIVPVLNEAARISESLRSLERLRRRGHEIIVVDGGSTDGSSARAVGLADQVLTATMGRARQMNTGANAASGAVLLFLHVDTELTAAAAEQLEQLCGRREACWGRFDVRFSSRRRMMALIAACMNVRSRWTGVATGDQAMFVDRELFGRVGGFPEIELMEDVALSKRLRAIARPVCLRGPVVTSPRKWVNEGVLRTVLLMWRLRLAYFLGGDPAGLQQRYYRSSRC